MGNLDVFKYNLNNNNYRPNTIQNEYYNPF